MCTRRGSCENIERIFCCPCFFIVWFSSKYYFVNHRKYNSCYERITYSMETSGNNSLYMCLVYVPHCFLYYLRFFKRLFEETSVCSDEKHFKPKMCLRYDKLIPNSKHKKIHNFFMHYGEGRL